MQLGEYVSLGKVETELKTCPVVENICVYGDAHKAYTVALIVPNPRSLEEIATNLGITSKTLEELCDDPRIEKAVLQELIEQAKKCKYFELKLNREILIIVQFHVCRYHSFFMSRQASEV